MDDYIVCHICGKNGCGDPLERHHVFGGPLRKLSEKYGAVVYLCGNECHRSGKEAAHNSKETSDKLKKEAQERIMEEQDWTLPEWRAIFGKSYI